MELPTTELDYRVCPRCKGDGWDDEYAGEICTNCWGDGEVTTLVSTSRHSAYPDVP